MASNKSCAIQNDKRFSKLRTKVLDILVQARAIIRSEKRWMQSDWGVDAEDDTIVDFRNFGKQYAEVCRVCAEGAIACSSRTFPEYRAAVAYIDEVVMDSGSLRSSIIDVNDNDGREATVSMFTKAIRKLRKEQAQA